MTAARVEKCQSKRFQSKRFQSENFQSESFQPENFQSALSSISAFKHFARKPHPSVTGILELQQSYTRIRKTRLIAAIFFMSIRLKAVLFDFNGVIINDEPIHEELLEQLLLEENLRMGPKDFQTYCLGRSDRACIRDLMAQRGRTLTEAELDKLIQRKARAYAEKLGTMEKLPIYPGLEDFIFKLRATPVKLAVVSGALRSEVEVVLSRINLLNVFDTIVAGDDITVSKPEPDGYLLAVQRLQNQFPSLGVTPENCLAIEDTFAGIEAAKRAAIPVVGIAHSYPFHMMQRAANWAVDYFSDLEFDRLGLTPPPETDAPTNAQPV
jgi:beta-phosphoglucomutase